MSRHGINVSGQYNVELLPDIILLTLCDYIEEPFQYHVGLLSLQAMFPPRPSDYLECLDASIFFFKNRRREPGRDEKILSDTGCCA